MVCPRTVTTTVLGVEKVGVGQAVSHCVGLLESEGVSVARTDQ